MTAQATVAFCGLLGYVLGSVQTGLIVGRLRRGIDVREVDPVRERKSVSAENTFERDLSSFRPLEKRLWAAAEEVSASAQTVAHTAAAMAELSARFQLPTDGASGA